MVLASALLVLAPVTPAASAPPSEAAEPVPEIVVLGRLRSLQASVGQDREGNWHCSLSESTGRDWLDDKFCRAVTKCVRKGAEENEEVDTCIRSSRKKLVARVEKEMKKGN